MSEEFFERLGERARHIIFGEATSYPNEHVFNAGINATIEALKEMMVGEPIIGEIQHGFDGVEEYTEVVVEEGGMGHLIFYAHRGVDGEEVTVLVFSHETKG